MEPTLRRAPGPPLARAVLRELGRLVVPVACPGCGAWDEVLCRRCAAPLDGPSLRCEHDAPRLDRMDGRPPLPVWTVAAYAGSLRDVVVAWKDGGRRDLTAPLGDALTRSARAVAGTWPVGGAPDGSDHPVLVVAVPSSAAARRRRGREPTWELAAAVVRGCRAAGMPAARARLLAHRGRARDQVGLGSRARGRNVAGRVVVRRSASGRPPGRVVVLVDDVVTTGATLAACERALTRSGARVVAAVTLAATPAPRSGAQWMNPGGPG